MPDQVASPPWFDAALAVTPEEHHLEVDGATVAYLAWGAPGAPVMALVHGGAAHARWWAHLAPLLAEDHRVVAVDLTGHGESDHRPAYRADQWAAEVVAVAEHERGDGDERPVVVGHSMGGFVTIVAAARHGAALAGAVVLDSPVRRPDPESEEGRRRGPNMFRQPKAYPDLETGMEHFHLVPPQPNDNPWLTREVARHSLRRWDDGTWRWKFDPRVFVERTGPSQPSDYAAALGRAACRLAIVSGARSAIVDDDVIDHMRELVAGSPAAYAGVPFVKVPEAHHHLLLDQPLATVTALRAILATWRPVGAQPAPVPTPWPSP